jgi:hypothetical protein
MNRHQQRVALLFGLLLISVALLGCADGNRAMTARAHDDDLAREHAQASAMETHLGLRSLNAMIR